jgi:hypothetical protein
MYSGYPRDGPALGDDTQWRRCLVYVIKPDHGNVSTPLENAQHATVTSSHG